MSGSDNEVQAARKRLEQRRGAWSLNTNAARIGVNLGDLRTILSALATAERRIAELDHECQASMAEIARGRERAEEAERLAEERLEALEPFALLAAQPDGTAGVNMRSPIGRWISFSQHRAAALVSAARETEGGA